MKYKSLNKHRLVREPLEKIFLDEWLENFDNKNFEHVINGEATERDKIIAQTIIQWLGSPVGQGFIESVMEKYRLVGA